MTKEEILRYINYAMIIITMCILSYSIGLMQGNSKVIESMQLTSQTQQTLIQCLDMKTGMDK